MSARTWWQAGMVKLIICFKHKPFVMHDSSLARRYVAPFTCAVIKIVTTFVAQRGKKNNQRFIHQNFHRFHICGIGDNTILAYFKLASWGGGCWRAGVISKTKTNENIKLF